MGDRSSSPGQDGPLLALVGSGDRRYREYILAALAPHFRLWLLDAIEPSWHRPYLTGFTLVDTHDPAALVGAVRRIGSEVAPVAGLFSYDEWVIDATAIAAEQLGLPGSPPQAVAACRDKAATRRILAGHGVGQPRSVTVTGQVEAVESAAAIGYPVVVKARRLAGSIGVQRVDDEQALVRAYRIADAAVFPDVVRDGADVLVEEYLDGPEISVDSAVVDGNVIPLALARKQTGLAPYFEETAHFIDGADPLLTNEALNDQLRLIHSGLGLTDGMTHTEFRLTRDGPRLIEINARLGGDFIPHLGYLATGVDFAVAAGQIATGCYSTSRPTRRRVAGIRFLYPPVDCRILNLRVRTDLLSPGVHAAVATGQPDQDLALPPRGFLSRYGYVIAVTDSVEQTNAELERAHDIIELEYKPI
ncbi:ATP-grasp domain-containing protein [Polymorphospora sp. NPDC050346]|uniref:ATP-grasp domain-containing protein n=1 Tax=Polymorphospora sp. NPDC050346 TaxID=3155780 RepID=UPI0034040FC3